MTFTKPAMTAISAVALSLSSFCLTLPAQAASVAMPGVTASLDGGDMLIEVRQGRSGTGVRGRDRDRDDDDSGRGRGRGRGGDDDSSSGRDRPRIPGGSGCDDPEDMLEHPECLVTGDGTAEGGDDNGGGGEVEDESGSGRDRPRIPGGSGCDDPEDLLEHPECSI
ncbi:hypothetical protein EU803_07435 [Loktanella sp. IMCC34160]|uniref:hypothetical protein n=1 Tax=Loktanella sp. IMCC34160 TaxID=2510646 RepID=UPI00101B692D|nr:hypothetical protein [Loktanella sp. IMCC34160]RYG92261.1 hypothetical protein EU803_07435 [Loktanella sp. IMCC34160]